MKKEENKKLSNSICRGSDESGRNRDRRFDCGANDDGLAAAASVIDRKRNLKKEKTDE